MQLTVNTAYGITILHYLYKYHYSRTRNKGAYINFDFSTVIPETHPHLFYFSLFPTGLFTPTTIWIPTSSPSFCSERKLILNIFSNRPFYSKFSFYSELKSKSVSRAKQGKNEPKVEYTVRIYSKWNIQTSINIRLASVESTRQEQTLLSCRSLKHAWPDDDEETCYRSLPMIWYSSYLWC